jgi:SAM-dependent methyltransferase
METVEIERLIALEDHHWWFQERRYLVSHLARQLVPGRALDVGAAGGGNTRVLKDHGWSTVAAELNPVAAGIARDRGLPIVRADVCQLPVLSGSIDLVLSFDVLEHIDDDEAAATEMVRVLRPGGTAFVAVPADPRLWSKHDEAVGHVRRYTRAELVSVLNRAGLQVDRIWSWNVLLRPLAALHRRRSEGSDLTEVAPSVNAALRTTVACERFLPVGRLPGVSLLAVARR